MRDILSITSPIYAIILIGYLLTRGGLFAKTDMHVLGKFVFTLALPALLFRAVALRPISEIFNPTYLLAYLGGSLLIIAGGYQWCRRVGRLSPTASTFRVMGMACPNSAYVGYPILLLTMAPVAGVALALNMVVENLFILPLLLSMASGNDGAAGRWRALRNALVRLARIPLVIGLLAGLVVSLLGWSLPEPIVRTVDMLASTSSAVALFVVGGTLVGRPLRGMAAQVAPVVVGKLVLHPLAVLLTVSVLPLLGMPSIATDLRVAVVVLAAMPMIGIYPTLAQAYGEEEFSAIALLVTTIASFFTLSGLLWLLRNLSAG